MPHDVFISYATNNIAEADKVCGYLEAEGISCWIAPRDVPVGDDFADTIWHAIQDCSVLVLIFSAAANTSPHVVSELKLAVTAKKTVVPIRIEDLLPSASVDFFLGAAQWLDAFGGIRKNQLQRLALGLRKRLGSTGQSTEDNQPVRSAVELKRRSGLGRTGAAAFTVYSVAAIVLVLIAWKLIEVVPHTLPERRAPTTSGGTDSKVRIRVNPADGLTYVFIPPGKFMMGCSPGDIQCDSDEKKPPQAEEIANGFWLGRTEVTQAAWAKVKGANPSNFKGDQLPVEQVDWTQAGEYCKVIGGRLPTEKEWEYAARARTTGARYGPLDAVAWYANNSGETTQPVGLKQANAYGLYDMLGNVWEWTSDNYDAERKIMRGGSWYFGGRRVRASSRSWAGPTLRDAHTGFRCVGEFR